MESNKLPSFVVNGGIKLPIGYRFCPTDEELVIHYLKRKAFSEPLPASVIPEFDVFQTEPWGLPGVFSDSREKRYFFSHKNDYGCGNISKIAAGSGYWKFTGKGRQIVASENNQLVGMRRTLVFCADKTKNTRWFMHELNLFGSRAASHPSQVPVGEWAVYRVFQKKRKLKRKGYNGKFTNTRKVQRLEETYEPSFIDFTEEAGSPPPCSPIGSEVCEISSNQC